MTTAERESAAAKADTALDIRTSPPSAGSAGSAPPEPPHQSLARSSSVMAIGTVASRFTGFLRTAVLLYAIGTRNLGDAYNVANNLPNAVYNLALGGILTSVVVPLLVNAAKRNRDGGEGYDQRIFTLGVLALGVITVAATAAAVPFTAIFGHGMANPATYHLTVIFTYFFLPQIFFYGVSSLAGAILNARGSFASPMWTPIVNNVVVIGVGIALIVVRGNRPYPAQHLHRGDPAARHRHHARHRAADGRDVAVAAPGRDSGGGRGSTSGAMRSPRSAAWAAGCSSTSWPPSCPSSRRLSCPTTLGRGSAASCAGAGYAAFSNAWQLFQLPYAIVGVSVITAMLPRMSAHAAAGSNRLLTRDFSAATRLSSVIIVPSAMILAVLGPPLAQGIFGHGSTSAASARYLGVDLRRVLPRACSRTRCSTCSLRAFYAMRDSRTPALVGAVSMAVRIVCSFLALAILPPADVVAGVGVGFGISSLVMAVWLWWILARRAGGLDTRRIGKTLVRMHVAAVPGTVFAIAVSVLIGRSPRAARSPRLPSWLSGAVAAFCCTCWRQGSLR